MAVEIIPERICKKCGGTKWYVNSKHFECWVCAKRRVEKYNEVNKEELKMSRKEYYEQNKEIFHKRHATYYQKNKEALRPNRTKLYYKYRDSLSDSYIRKHAAVKFKVDITNVTSEQMTECREGIKATRLKLENNPFLHIRKDDSIYQSFRLNNEVRRITNSYLKHLVHRMKWEYTEKDFPMLRERILAKRKERANRPLPELTDRYVKHAIYHSTGKKFKEITEEEVVQRRKEILLFRQGRRILDDGYTKHRIVVSINVLNREDELEVKASRDDVDYKTMREYQYSLMKVHKLKELQLKNEKHEKENIC